MNSKNIFDELPEYLLAKSALNKIADCATFSSKVEITPEECRALFSQKIIDLDQYQAMLA